MEGKLTSGTMVYVIKRIDAIVYHDIIYFYPQW